MIQKIDHMVITVKNAAATLEFYEKLGFKAKQAQGRYELFAGDFKLNVHILGQELSPRAAYVQTGSADMCFELTVSVDVFKAEVEKKGIAIELGVVSRTGVRGEMRSVYLRDPDENLLEFCSYS